MKSIFDLNKDLLKRYLTLIDTIQTASDTFYDAYNNFCEQLLKSICDKEKLTYSRGSISYLIDNKAIKYYLINEMKLNDKLLDKLKDYALKINKHKHQNEKQLNIDLAISYMTCLYEIINDINKHYNFRLWNVKVTSYIMNIYGKKEGVEVNITPVVNISEVVSNNESNKQNSVNVDNKMVQIPNVSRSNPKRERTRLYFTHSENIFKLLKKLVPILYVIMLIGNILYCVFMGMLNSLLLVIGFIVIFINHSYLIYAIIRMIKQPYEFNIKDAKHLPVDYENLLYEPFVSLRISFFLILLLVYFQVILAVMSIFSFMPSIIISSVIYVITAVPCTILLQWFYKSYILLY